MFLSLRVLVVSLPLGKACLFFFTSEASVEFIAAMLIILDMSKLAKRRQQHRSSGERDWQRRAPLLPWRTHARTARLGPDGAHLVLRFANQYSSLTFRPSLP